MTAPKRVDLAGIGAAVAKSLESATVHQVTGVEVTLIEHDDGSREVDIRATVNINRRRLSSAVETVDVTAFPGDQPEKLVIGSRRPRRRRVNSADQPTLLPDEGSGPPDPSRTPVGAGIET